MCAKPVNIKAPPSPEQIAATRRLYLKLTVFIVIVGGSIAGLVYLKRQVELKYAHPTVPPTIVLKNRPTWMSDYLAARITDAAKPKGVHSAFDHQLLVDVADALKSDPDVSPWIKEIRQVRRTYVHSPGDTIEVDCEFRAPVALVKWNESFWFVDNEGTKLPEQFNAQQVPKVILSPDGKVNIRIIEGARHVPSDPGMRWEGDDLTAGIEMVKLLHNQPFADEIVKVDVSNFQGRDNPKDAYLKLITRYNTEIRWGRPISAKDAFVEVAGTRKLEVLERIRKQYGRVDAKQPWLDIRFDKITCPAPQPSEASADGL